MKHTEYTANIALATTAAMPRDKRMPTAAEHARHVARQQRKPNRRRHSHMDYETVAAVSRIVVTLFAFAGIGAMLAL